VYICGEKPVCRSGKIVQATNKPKAYVIIGNNKGLIREIQDRVTNRQHTHIHFVSSRTMHSPRAAIPSLHGGNATTTLPHLQSIKNMSSTISSGGPKYLPSDPKEVMRQMLAMKKSMNKNPNLELPQTSNQQQNQPRHGETGLPNGLVHNNILPPKLGDRYLLHTE
jgi:hypothetical protein